MRLPTLRREAQSTSALEGTYAPLAEVLVADDEKPPTAALMEILNYVRAANYGFAWLADGRPISASFLSDLQGILMRGTPLVPVSGRLRDAQVVVGRRGDADPRAHHVHNARFVPSPDGVELESGVNALVVVVRASALRADSAHALVDLAIANPSFTVRKVEADPGSSYGRANKLVGQLCDLGVLQVVDAHAYKRRFLAPRVLEVLRARSSD